MGLKPKRLLHHASCLACGWFGFADAEGDKCPKCGGHLPAWDDRGGIALVACFAVLVACVVGVLGILAAVA